MPRPNSIDKLGLGSQVLALAATMGVRSIAKKLAEDGHTVSPAAVHRYLTEHLAERREVTEVVRVAVQTQMGAHALNDIQQLGQLRDALVLVVFKKPPQVITKAGALFEADGTTAVVDRHLWLKATKELRETLETCLKFAGAGGGDGAPAQDYTAIVREEMQRALSRAPITLGEIEQRYPLPPAPSG